MSLLREVVNNNVVTYAIAEALIKDCKEDLESLRTVEEKKIWVEECLNVSGDYYKEVEEFS